MIDMCRKYSETAQIDVLSKLLNVFRPTESVIPLLNQYEGTHGILEMIVKDHGLNLAVILNMFDEETAKTVINLDPASPPLEATAKSQPKSGKGWVGREHNQRYDDVDSDSHTPTQDPEELASDADCPEGNAHLRAQPGLPEKCNWEGPSRGDDADGTFMREGRTGRAKRDRSSSLDPEKRYERDRGRSARAQT